MGKKLQQTPVEGEPTPNLLTAAVIDALNDEITSRSIPFIDDITEAENIQTDQLGSYVNGAQEQALRNLLDPEHEDYIPYGPERQLFIAETRGKTRKAVLARLQELSIHHAYIAASRLEALQRGVLPQLNKGVTPSQDALAEAADSFQDLARGIAKRPPNIAFAGDLAASVKAIEEEVRADPSRLTPPRVSLIANDQRKKQVFWTRGFEGVYAFEGGFAGDPSKILAQFEDPERMIKLLRLRRYFPRRLGEEAISS